MLPFFGLWQICISFPKITSHEAHSPVGGKKSLITGSRSRLSGSRFLPTVSDRRSSGNVRVRRNGVRSYSPVSAIRLIFTTATPTNSAVHVLSGARRPTSRRAVSHFPGKNERSTISQALYPLQNLAKRRGYFDISTIQRGYNALKRWRGPEKNGAITNGRGDAGAPFPPHCIRPFHTKKC